MSTITSTQLCEKTGVTKKQIYEWTRNGSLTPLPREFKHDVMEFDVDVIDKVRFLKKASEAVRSCTIKMLAENFEDGEIYLAPGLVLIWETTF